MPTKRVRERDRESMIYWSPLTGLCTSLRSSSLVLQDCYSAKNRALLYLDFSFTDSPPIFFKQNGYSAKKTELLHLDFSFTDSIFPRWAEPFLWKWHSPSSCRVFLHWFSSHVPTELLSCENTTIPLDFFRFDDNFGTLFNEKVVIKNVRNFNHHDFCSPNKFLNAFMMCLSVVLLLFGWHTFHIGIAKTPLG